MADPAIDFSAVFLAVPRPLLILAADPRFTIVAANDAYLDATMTSREIRGQALFDVFPDNPTDPAASGTRNLGASLERVRARRAPDLMPVQRYDIRRRHSTTTSFDERHWAPHNTPVVTGGTVTHILHHVEDVTALVRAGIAGAREKPPLSLRTTLRLDASADLTTLRDVVRGACARANFGDAATMDLLVVASELANNMLVHAGGGQVEIDQLPGESHCGLRLRFCDEGPGIRHVDDALAGGHSTVGTLGRGLSGSRKLVDEFALDTHRRGTTVTVTKWTRARTDLPRRTTQRP